MKEKTFRNSPKGRSELPEKEGDYVLLDASGNDIQEWIWTDNLKERIKEEHYCKKFSFIKINKKKK